MNVYREVLMDKQDQLLKAMKHIIELKKMNEDLIEALKYYAEGKHYYKEDVQYINSHHRPGDVHYLESDFGEVAENVLKRYGLL